MRIREEETQKRVEDDEDDVDGDGDEQVRTSLNYYKFYLFCLLCFY